MPVKELYELACSYITLPDMARYVIGSFFGRPGWVDFQKDEDQYAEDLFRKAAVEDRLHELKFHVIRHKGYTDAANGKYHH